jgi:hypothetical protein
MGGVSALQRGLAEAAHAVADELASRSMVRAGHAIMSLRVLC